jgi:tetratricopeptide (TPR) repeat protein
LQKKDLAQAEDALGRAVRADSFDDLAPVDACELLRFTGTMDQMSIQDIFHFFGDNDPRFTLRGLLLFARDSLERSRRFPQEEKSFHKAAYEYYCRAVELNPADARLRIEYAGYLLLAEEKAEALRQLDAAEEIDRRLRAFDPDSHKLLNDAEKAEIRRLRQRTESRDD